jgi:hypothetical protein
MSQLNASQFPVRTFGGPTALFEYGGLRFLTDPTFDGPGGYASPGGPTLTKTAPPPPHPPTSAPSTWSCSPTTSTPTTSTPSAAPCSPTSPSPSPPPAAASASGLVGLTGARGGDC